MPINFAESFDIPPIPTSARGAARQARQLAERIDRAGGVANAVAAAVQVVQNTIANDPPTELGRLRSLYRATYTADELATLVRNTFVTLGLAPPGA